MANFRLSAKAPVMAEKESSSYGPIRTLSNYAIELCDRTMRHSSSRSEDDEVQSTHFKICKSQESKCRPRARVPLPLPTPRPSAIAYCRPFDSKPRPASRSRCTTTTSTWWTPSSVSSESRIRNAHSRHVSHMSVEPPTSERAAFQFAEEPHDLPTLPITETKCNRVL